MSKNLENIAFDGLSESTPKNLHRIQPIYTIESTKSSQNNVFNQSRSREKKLSFIPECDNSIPDEYPIDYASMNMHTEYNKDIDKLNIYLI